MFPAEEREAPARRGAGPGRAKSGPGCAVQARSRRFCTTCSVPMPAASQIWARASCPRKPGLPVASQPLRRSLVHPRGRQRPQPARREEPGPRPSSPRARPGGRRTHLVRPRGRRRCPQQVGSPAFKSGPSTQPVTAALPPAPRREGGTRDAGRRAGRAGRPGRHLQHRPGRGGWRRGQTPCRVGSPEGHGATLWFLTLWVLAPTRALSVSWVPSAVALLPCVAGGRDRASPSDPRGSARHRGAGSSSRRSRGSGEAWAAGFCALRSGGAGGTQAVVKLKGTRERFWWR